jgi:CDP-paratose 2-epimerase
VVGERVTTVLVTGGAGFVGSTLALTLAERHPEWSVVALDNLRRRGSELNLPRLRAAGVRFVHGDVRHLEDVEGVGEFDALVECSADASVLAGVEGDTRFVFDTNLMGAYHCLECAARYGAQVVFLSTSRVYPVAALESLHWEEQESRYAWSEEQSLPGASGAGISESFPLTGARTLYGATKLAAELLVAEYCESRGIAAVVDRCGVIAGPWQMGKVDQGVFTHWLLSHLRGRPLTYIGYGGSGKQVRDVLHVDDLADLLELQLADPADWSGRTFNVGGGAEGTLSLLETTALCREITGRKVDVTASDEVRPGDVRLYVSDCTALFEHTDWRPGRSPRDVLEDTWGWMRDNEALLEAL